MRINRSGFCAGVAWLSLAVVVGMFPDALFAADTGMPWESPLNKLIASLTGPVAKAVGVIAIVVAGLGIALGESGGGMQRLFQIVFGLSIAFTASSFIATLFGFSNGALLP